MLDISIYARIYIMSPSWKCTIQHSMMRSNRLSHTALSIPHTLVCTISYVISITPGMLCSGFISHHQSCTTFPVIHGCLCFMEGRVVFILWEGFTFWGTFSLFLSALVLFKLDLLLLSPTILRGTSLFPSRSIVVPSVFILVLKLNIILRAGTHSIVVLILHFGSPCGLTHYLCFFPPSYIYSNAWFHFTVCHIYCTHISLVVLTNIVINCNHNPYWFPFHPYPFGSLSPCWFSVWSHTSHLDLHP